jgi:diacylglycerol diphosphate phosphatase/phosphatidate phosphatase
MTSPIFQSGFKWRFSDLVLLAILAVLYVVTYDLPPFQRQFYINDLTISHPFATEETVSNTQLFVYAVWVPLLIIFVVSIILTKPKHKIYHTYVALLGLCLSVFITSITTNILKNFIGRHRPDFLARCVPKPDTLPDVLVFAKDVCTTDDMGLLLDGFRTTPSGHSSISFAGLLYLSLWLGGQLVINSEAVGSWRSLVAFLPSFCAALIAISRTEDYRHHFVDVIIGSILGSVIGWWSYFRLFPSLYNDKCYNPILTNLEESDDKIDNPGYSLVENV